MPRHNPALRFAIRLVVIYVLLVMPWPGVGSGFSALYRSAINSLAWVLGLGDHLHVSVPPDQHPRGDAELATINPATGQRLRIEHGSRDWGYMPLAASLALVLAVPAPWPRRLRAAVFLTVLTLLSVALRIAIAALYGLGSVGVINLGEAMRKGIGQVMLAFSATPVNSFVVPIMLWLLVLHWTYDWTQWNASRDYEFDLTTQTKQ